MSVLLYDQLKKAFKADEHEFNFQGHIYVSVNATIERLNELLVVENEWDMRIRLGIAPGAPLPPNAERILIPSRWDWSSEHFSHSLNPVETRGGKPQYDCFTVGELSIEGLGTRMGSGADTNADLDTAAKSSQAYAMRKAGNQFGLAMYLLRNPAKEAELVKFLVNADQDDPVAMKQAVTMLMDIRKLDPTAANLLSEFNVTLQDIKDDSETFLKILQKENRI